MAQAKALRRATRRERADLKRGGFRRHETQTSSSHAPSENRHTKNRQDCLEPPRRTIGGLYRLCSCGQPGRKARDSKTVWGKIHSVRRPLGCIGTQTHAEGKTPGRSAYSLRGRDGGFARRSTTSPSTHGSLLHAATKIQKRHPG